MLRLTARWLAPVTAAPIAHAAVLIDERGRIAAVGPADRVPRPAGAAAIDLGEAIVLPGLVNVHAHPELTALRGLLEDLPFHHWILALMHVKRESQLREQDYDVGARWTCVEALRAGITTLGATEDSAAAFAALRDAGMRGIVYREVFGPAPEQADDAVAALRIQLTAMRAHETDLVRVGVSPHAPYSVSDRLFERVAALARAEAVPVAVHAAESEAEDALVRDGTGPFAEGLRRRGIATPPRAGSTIALLERTGVLGLAPLLIHAIRLHEGDVARIASAGARVAHCPVANARLGHGIAPISALLDAGVPVGIGTDSVAANNRIDLLEEARMAQVLQRARLGDGTLLPPARLLRMATLDGARVLGLDERIGSIEIGKDGDLCAVSLAGAHVRPVHDPLAALFMAARASDVVLAMVRGRILLRDGVLTTLDEAGTRVALEAVADRIRGRARPT
jgi:5-methylthioadenosine/S-adenosylhomocysteine deaminase